MGDYAPLLERAFTLDPREQSYPIESIEGEVPSFIRGRYYLNGPARFAQADLTYRHWLDGDGMVCALRFEPECITFTNRFVRSHKFNAEAESKQPIFRTFGTSFVNDQMKRGMALESPVNVSVYPYRGSLLAFGEQGLPWELDPITLATRGVCTFAGRLNEVSPFSAHPKFDPMTGEMFNFGIAFSTQNPQLNIYCFAPDGQLRYRKRLSLDYPCSIHDFTLGPRFLAFYLSPYLLDMGAMIEADQTLMDALRWMPEQGSYLLIISRETGEAVASLPIGHRYCLHLINSFERDDRLMIDVIEYERPIYDQYQVIPDLFTDVCEAQPVRFVLDPNHPGDIDRRESSSHLSPDFPTVEPRRATQGYDDFWMLGMGAPRELGRKFFNQLLHLRWSDDTCDLYSAPAMCYLGGEPVWIGDPNDSNTGVIMCQFFDANRVCSAFALFNAFDVAAGPIAMLHLRDPIPLLFHASFQTT